MTRTRPMAHAGSFYPAAADALRDTVALYLSRARPSFGMPCAIVAPHAGWDYCGQVLGTAFLAAMACEEVSRLILVGPSHYDPISGIVTTDADAFETPFGPMSVDRAALGEILVDAQAHAKEHALEVHLPFLYLLFPESSIAPLLIGGGASPEDTARHLLSLGCGEQGVLTIISSDLSHYLPVDQLRAMDRETLRLIEAGDYAAIGTERACAADALKGMGAVARHLSLNAAALDLSDSYAATGQRPNTAVGYSAIAYYHSDARSTR